PLIVTSNPPYVPLAPRADARRPSISGGPDGLKWAPAIIGHARTLDSDLGLTIASYSTPRKAVRLLRDAGYRVHSITLCPLPLGDFTLRHMEQILALEQNGEAVLWRRPDDPVPAYFILGLACRRTASADAHPDPTGDDLMRLLRTAARSRTPRLETLD
ncbi:hypothetical protein, partial [Streptomyces sp. URMC 129]|uniref:hypothetical protein n=1 Tax=Streptomyces sp. URMC 129 TaxID=3423407 RepID=UPI003F1D7151